MEHRHPCETLKVLGENKAGDEVNNLQMSLQKSQNFSTAEVDVNRV